MVHGPQDRVGRCAEGLLDIDTAGGQSGSAVYRIKDGKRFAVGIHAYGVGSGQFNSATRINRPVFDNLQTWRAAHP